MTSFHTIWGRTGRFAVFLLATSLVSACGNGAKTESSADPAPPPVTNTAPTISGSPATFVIQDQEYTFTPIASDSDGDALTFSITNLPSWAGFDTVTGILSGTPGVAHIGTTLDVTISVSDGEASASLAPFDLEVQQIQLGSARISWDVPTTNADGSPMTDLAGYQVHYGMASQDYSAIVMIDDAATNSIPLDELGPGAWFFAVLAVDRTGNRSAFSLEVSKVVAP